MITNWDQLRIVPQITRVESRKQCDTSYYFFDWILSVPLIPASMHSLFSYEMMKNVEMAGSFFPQPRLDTDSKVGFGRCFSLSSGVDEKQLIRSARICDDYKGVLFIEIANAYQKEKMKKSIVLVRKEFPKLKIVGGTVAEIMGARMLEDLGYDAVLLGIGVGKVCDTTTNTGVGLSAPMSLHQIRQHKESINIPVILSGGVRTYGDFCKAIALGADIVMSGSLFARCVDTKTGGKEYWGEASEKEKGKKSLDVKYVEGHYEQLKPNNKTSYDIIIEAKQALQSAMSYSDSFDLNEFRESCELINIENGNHVFFERYL